MKCPCGCILETHSTGAKKNIYRCPEHVEWLRARGPLDRSYYELHGVFQSDPPHAREFLEAFGSLAPANGTALEIGCGISPYVEVLTGAGYRYVGLDPSPWAAEYMRDVPGVFEVLCRTVEDDTIPAADLILAAHSLEHVADAPVVLAEIAASLTPGGKLYLIVPDDTDSMNPDHVWFFSPDSLERMVHDAGLVVDSVKAFQRVEKEKFIYLAAHRVDDRFPQSIPGLAGHSWTYAAELAKLIDLLPPRGTMLEIGSADGVTAAAIAIARPDARIVSVDPYPGHGQGESGFPSADVRIVNWKRNARPNQSLWVGSAGDLHQFTDHRFDLVFVDGEHGFPNVYSDLMYADRMGVGTIAAHDYDPVAWPQTARAVDRFCQAEGYRVAEVIQTLAVLEKMT